MVFTTKNSKRNSQKNSQKRNSKKETNKKEIHKKETIKGTKKKLKPKHFLFCYDSLINSLSRHYTGKHFIGSAIPVELKKSWV